MANQTITILHVLSQVPDFTGSATFLRMLINTCNNYDFIKQYVVYGIPYYETDKYLLDLPKKFHYPVLFETDELPFSVPGMSDIEPYISSKYSEMLPVNFKKYYNAFRAKLKSVINTFKPDIIWSHHLWLVSSILSEIKINIPQITFCHATEIRQLQLAPNYSKYVISRSKNIDKVLVASLAQKNEIIEKYGLNKSNELA